MDTPLGNLTAARAAARLGITSKALRLYERRGLLEPGRTAAGWRVYGPADMARAAEIVALRALGLSLTQIAHALSGEAPALDTALAAHAIRLRDHGRQLADIIERVEALRERSIGRAGARLGVEFELPWPWGGERFALDAIGALNYITGPLGSGKTRLAERLAAALPDAEFLGLDRLGADTAPEEAVERTLACLEGDGATRSDALRALVAALEARTPSILVVDLVEQGLDEATQRALIAQLRLRRHCKRALFLMTRSSVILDLDAVGPDESILYCPANHNPPFSVRPCPGARGYEAVATCLATPDVRARSIGTIAVRRAAA